MDITEHVSKDTVIDPQDSSLIDEVFSCDDIQRLLGSIVRILPFRGYSNSLFVESEAYDLITKRTVQYLVKIAFYHKTEKEIYAKFSDKITHSHSDAEIAILTLFKEHILDTNISPCIVEIYDSVKCDGLEKLIPPKLECKQIMTATIDTDVRKEISPMVTEDDNKTYAIAQKRAVDDEVDYEVKQVFCEYWDRVKAGLAHNICSATILEYCDNSFSQFIDKNVDTPMGVAMFKSLLFQIIYTFARIKERFPGFYHNDLHTGNILLKYNKNFAYLMRNPKVIIYEWPAQNKKWYVPYFGITPKIIDFGFSNIESKKKSERVINAINDDKQLMYYRADNDLLVLFASILNHSNISDTTYYTLDDILSRLEPSAMYRSYYAPYVKQYNDKLNKPIDMVLNDDVWEEYLNPQSVVITPTGKKQTKSNVHAIYNGN